MFSPLQKSQLLELLTVAFQRGLETEKEMKEKRRKQPRTTKPHLTITQPVIDLAVRDAMTDVLKGWLKNNIKPITFREIEDIEHIKSDFYRCRYDDKQYLVVQINTISIPETLTTLLVLEDIELEFLLKPLFIRVLTGAIKGGGMWSRGDLLFFYPYSGNVTLPFLISVQNLSYFVYTFATLYQRNVDLRSFTAYYFDGSLKLLPNVAFSFAPEKQLTYINSGLYIRDKGSGTVDQRNDHTIKEYYIQEATKYSEEDITNKNMGKLFECMLATVPARD